MHTNQNMKQKNEQISKTLRKKDILLKEIHHRVKNNLQVISSLLSLQSRQLESPQAREAMQSSRNRIKSMALIHQKLYQDEDLIGVEIEIGRAWCRERAWSAEGDAPVRDK